MRRCSPCFDQGCGVADVEVGVAALWVAVVMTTLLGPVVAAVMREVVIVVVLAVSEAATGWAGRSAVAKPPAGLLASMIFTRRSQMAKHADRTRQCNTCPPCCRCEHWQ